MSTSSKAAHGTRHALRRERGFTLMELMIVVLLLGFMAVLAVPNIRDMVLNARISGSTNEFVAAVKLARSEALKRHAVVRVCEAKDAGTEADPAATLCSKKKNLSKGYMVIAENIDESSDPPDPEFIPIRVGTPGPNTILKAESNGTDDYLFGFNKKGELIGDPVRITLCDDREEPEQFGREIGISSSGVITSNRIRDGETCL